MLMLDNTSKMRHGRFLFYLLGLCSGDTLFAEKELLDHYSSVPQLAENTKQICTLLIQQLSIVRNGYK